MGTGRAGRRGRALRGSRRLAGADPVPLRHRYRAEWDQPSARWSLLPGSAQTRGSRPHPAQSAGRRSLARGELRRQEQSDGSAAGGRQGVHRYLWPEQAGHVLQPAHQTAGGGGGGGTPDDSLIVSITDGNSTVEVEVITSNSPNLSSWQQNSFKVSDYLAPTSSMQIIFYTADLQNGNSNYVEAGVDKFQVTNSAIPPVSVVDLSEKDFILYPNPSNNFIVVKSEEIGDIEIYNLLGEKVLTSKKFTLLKEIDISSLPKGLYILK